MLLDDADPVVFASDADSDRLVFLTRSYSRRVHAPSGGPELVVYPANVHLCAIEVPAGEHRVVVSI